MDKSTDSDGAPGKLAVSRIEDRFTSVHWVVLVLLSMGMADAYLTRTAGAYNTTLQREFNQRSAEVGWALSGFELGYIWLQIPGGWFGQVLGNRRALPLMCVGWSLCAMGWSFAPDLNTIFFCRLGMGLFQGGLIPCSAAAVNEWYSLKQRGITSGVITGGMQVGAIVALQLTALLLTVTSWRTVLFQYSAIGLIWAGLFYTLFRNRPSEHPRLTESIADQPRSSAAAEFSWSETFKTLGSVSLWLLCLQMFFRAAAYSFYQNWFPTFLEKGRHVSRVASSSLTLPPIVAVLVGGLIGGSLIDVLFRLTNSRYVSRSGTAMLAMVASAFCTLQASYVTSSGAAVTLATLGAFFAGVAGPVTWAAALDVCGKRTGVLLGLVNTCGNIGAWLCASRFGYLFSYVEANNADWNVILQIVAAIYFCAALSWLFLRPDRSPAADAAPAGR